MKATKRLLSILLFAAISVGAWALEQADGYYLIGSVQDWKDFATLVETTPTANAKMKADIDLGDDQTVIGGANNGSTLFYKGTFDGQGHTLTVAYNVTSGDRFTSPFSLIEGATIKNLHLDGTVNSTYAYGGSIASILRGANTIENVWNSVTNECTKGSWAQIGAFIGYLDTGATATISDCLYTGSITNPSAIESYCGYFNATWGDKPTVNNCLVLGTFSGSFGFNGNYNNCYCKHASTTGVTQTTDGNLSDGTTTASLNGERTGEAAPWIQDPVTNQPMLKMFALQQNADGYYLIGSAQNWKDFATLVNNGNTTANAKLTDDVSISTMINQYSGVFDGDNHTITANITGTGGEAPFKNISGATIKNVKVDGTIHGGRHTGGLVAIADGSNSITNVMVSASISGADYCGGILGHAQASTTTIDGCVFAGSIVGEGSSPVSAICGWNHGGLVTITNCIEVGSSYTNCNSFNPFFFGSGTASVSNCFYLNPKNSGNDYGAQLYASQPDGVLCKQMELVGNTYFLPVTITGIEEKYELVDGAVTPEPIVTFMDNTLVKGTDYTLSYSNNDAVGTASVTFTGTGSYSGSQTINFTLYTIDWYNISSAEDWKTVAEGINNGTIPADTYIRMTADIDLGDCQTVFGLSNVCYQGTFDGQGHTLTVHLDIATDGVAPFRHINNATIKNLAVAGSVTGGIHSSGLVGGIKSASDNLISNVMVSVEITTTGSHCGGIIGHGEESNTTLQDCLFNGSINGGSNVGVLWGWSNYPSVVTITSCLENGTYTNCGYDPVFRTYSGTNVVTNTYYVNGSSTYGTQATSEILADGTVTNALNNGRTGDDAPWVQQGGKPMLKMFAVQQDAEGNYLLSSASHWKQFAAIVETIPTANAKMTADIDLGDDQTRIGTITEPTPNDAVKYQGIFDGQGHTLKIAYVVSSGSTNLAAPFAKVNGATIKNMHITGTITSTGCHPCSVVADSWGTTTIQNIWSDVIIQSIERSGGDWIECSSLVGCMKGGNLTLSDCLFTGSVSATGGHNGCFIGYIDGGTADIYNSLSTGEFTGSFSYPGTHHNCYVKQFPSGVPSDMQCTDDELANGTIATALQYGRDEEIWVQDRALNQPMLKLFASESGISTGEALPLYKVQSSKITVQSEEWYSISGQKLSGKPTAKGIYIVTGKKVIMK